MTVVCSWCSTEVKEGATECPSCGANLVADGEPNVPGVTAVDAASIIRSKSATQPRNRLLSWISGEYVTDVPSKDEAQAIAPPDLEVRREILRLELEAEVANLQAEADALRAEAAAEGRTVDAPASDGSETSEALASEDSENPASEGSETHAPEAAAATGMTASEPDPAASEDQATT